MARLSRDVRANVKSGSSIRATITDVSFNKASVRLLKNGQLMHNLMVVGGPVLTGQEVRVDFTTPVPTIVVTGQEGLTASDVQDVVDQTVAPPYILPPANSGISSIAIYYNGEFVANVQGLNFVDGT